MFANIQLLRAIAAIFVIFHHIAPHYQAMGGHLKSFEIAASWGFTGVDLFFVISGFITAHTTFHKERTFSNAKTFVRHRASRIFLGYWPFLGFAIVLTSLLSPRSLQDFDLLGSVFLTSIDINRLLLPISWSLSFELYFYAIFTLLFALPAKAAKWAIHIALAAILLRMKFIYIDSGPQYFFFSHFLAEFFAGSVLYIHRDKLKSPWMALVFATAIPVAYAYGINWDARNNVARVITFGSGALFIVALAITLENCKIYKARQWMVGIGDASYTIYLSHLSLISIFWYSGLRTFLSHQHMLVAEACFFLCIAAIVLISIVFYRKVELPVYRWATGYRPTQQKLACHPA